MLHDMLKYFNPLSYKRRTIKSVSLTVIVIGLIFLCYQLFIVNIIEADNRKEYEKREALINNSLRIERLSKEGKVKINADEGKFTCVKSRKVIDKSKVNDDYCDCPLDGSDEPRTSACINGVFHCQLSFREVSIPSSRVNDGICDCCDGSDEWQELQSPISLASEVQKKIGLYLSPCINFCEEEKLRIS